MPGYGGWMKDGAGAGRISDSVKCKADGRVVLYYDASTVNSKS